MSFNTPPPQGSLLLAWLSLHSPSHLCYSSHVVHFPALPVSVLWFSLQVTANVPILRILSTLKMKVTFLWNISLTRPAWHHFPEDGILYSDCDEIFKSCMFNAFWYTLFHVYTQYK
jgi:hypothetical protein